jgi:hypothetical protein
MPPDLSASVHHPQPLLRAEDGLQRRERHRDLPLEDARQDQALRVVFQPRQGRAGHREAEPGAPETTDVDVIDVSEYHPPAHPVEEMARADQEGLGS